MERLSGSKLGKEYNKAVYCHPSHLTYMQSTLCEMPGWMNHKLESRLLGKISITSDRYAYDTTLMAGSEEELKGLLKVKEQSEKAGLKLNIQKTKIMASSPITSWQTDGETMETVTDFIFLGFKITADSECSHDIKRCLLLGRKDVTNLDSNIKKQRHHFADKGPYSQRHGFPVVMYRCDSWTIRLSAEGLILSNCGVGEDS